MQLRPYQEEAVNAAFNEWQMGRGKTLLVLATGTGKTIIFSTVAKRFVEANPYCRVLVLAHRDELLQQAADKLKFATGLDADFEKAELTAINSNKQIVIGSIQTLNNEKRLKAYSQNAFNLIIIDEAHHCLSESYQKVLGYFNNSKVLGVTATPDRADKKALSKFFESMAYEYSIARAIREGYLSPMKALMIPLSIDLTNVKESCGDYVLSSLGDTIEPYLQQIAQQLKNYCLNRKTVVFLPLVQISQQFRDLLNSMGFRAAEVNGESTNRKEILKAFEENKFNVICNSMLLTEGWDCPSVDCIVVLRPTKSRALYTQMVGRGMRLSEGKTELLLLDFLWQTQKLSLCRPSALISKDEEHAEKVNEKIKNANEAVDIMEAEEEADIDIIEQRKKALAKQLEEQKHKKAKLVDPLFFAFSINSEVLTDYQPTYDWESQPISDKQKTCLEKYGIDYLNIRTKGEASVLLDILSRRQNENLARPKQIRKLESYGFKNVYLWIYNQATQMIGAIAANRWRVPLNIVPSQYQPR